MYNLGLVYKEMNNYEAALPWFEKLHTVLRSSPDVIYQIADIHYTQGNLSQALEWLNILISVVPTDPAVLAKLGIYLKVETNLKHFTTILSHIDIFLVI